MYLPVEAVWVWAYTAAPFKAAYGRFPSPGGYTKDYLQVSDRPARAMEAAFNVGASPSVLEFVWPGGTSAGLVRRATDYNGVTNVRLQLAWASTGTAPAPWRVSKSPSGVVAIPGDPDATDVAGANAQLAALQALGLDPYILAVKLVGDGARLHARAFLGNPPPGQTAHGVSALPSGLSQFVQSLSGSSSDVYLPGAATSPVLSGLAREVHEGLRRHLNVLLVGPPGTGKTVVMEQVRRAFEATGQLLFDPSVISNPFRVTQARTTGVVFHPSYGYEDFVAGLQPEASSAAGGGGIRLVAQPGPLLSLAHWTADADRTSLLCIDEFNRGNAAAIFGDTMALLEPDKRRTAARQGQQINRPYPRNAMDVAAADANGSGTSVDNPVSFPIGLHVLAAMNSSDRSVAPIDAALRRRFAIMHVAPDYAALAAALGVPRPAGPYVPAATATPESVRELAIRVLEALNNRVAVVLGEDFLLGPALVWELKGDNGDEVAQSLAQAFDERIGATLRLSFVDQDEALAAVLRLPADPANSAGIPTVAAWNNPSGELAHVASPKVHLLGMTGRGTMDIVARLSALL